MVLVQDPVRSEGGPSRGQALFVSGVRGLGALAVLSAALVACEADKDTPPADDGITYRSEVQPVTKVTDALAGVLIPPFRDCRPGAKNGGEVCTWVSISGATAPGEHFADQADCAVVRTQRPYYAKSPAGTTQPDDPRLSDARFMGELAWARDQIRATGCACCHDSGSSGVAASQWDIAAEGIWLDSISDTGLALFSGLADSSVLGAYPAMQNNGFDRTATGIPTTETERMKGLVLAELARRGISESEASSVPPFGGPIYQNQVRRPEACGPGEGIDPEGRVQFPWGEARYVYVLEAGSKNPGVPPNLDRPEGTLWRLDVLPSKAGLASGFAYGTTPRGSFQDTPAAAPAPALVRGRTYQLTALLDVGIPIVNCLFVFGEPLATQTRPDAGVLADAGSVSPDAGAETGVDAGMATEVLGRACTDNAGCAAPAPYCAVQPGQREGYCTITGCKEDPTVCPSGWRCFDLSVFAPGQPSVCLRS
jgi:hypothetical protein